MEYLGYMADAAQERGTTPIFLTPTAAIQCSGSTAVGNRGFLTETRRAATDNDVTLIDLNQLSVELYNSEGLCPNNDAYTGNDAVGQFFCEDHTHFEDAGAIKMAGAVAQAVEDQGLLLAGYLAK
jgi:lysophospholipase L1-like esterase